MSIIIKIDCEYLSIKKIKTDTIFKSWSKDSCSRIGIQAQVTEWILATESETQTQKVSAKQS